ncbi:MAG TPA: hypothetical protein VL523_05660 [Terriglobia bacterium]|nr:hypothetical protein [Terriglobia bacterium]
MSLSDSLLSVWRQSLAEELPEVELGGQRFRVGRTRVRGLRTVDFEYEGRALTGIEQNPDTGSRWAALARQGQRVMQFSTGRRYFANVAEGNLLRYPAWAALKLPD